MSFADAQNGTIVGAAGTILRTTNGGETWDAQDSGTSANLAGVYFTDANTGTAVGLAGTMLCDRSHRNRDRHGIVIGMLRNLRILHIFCASEVGMIYPAHG